MAKIQTYTQRVAQQPANVPGVQSHTSKETPSLEAVEARVNQAGQIVRIDDAIQDQYQKQALEIKDRQDKNMVKDAFINFGDQLRELDQDFKNRKRRDTKGLSKEAMQKADQLLNKMTNGLEGDKQREMFSSIAGSRRASFLDSVSSHELSELEAWNKESSQAMSHEAIQSAVDNPSIDNIQNSKLAIDIAVNSEFKGASAETLKYETEQRVSKMHTAVINSMSVKSASAAKEYYEGHKKDIDAPVRTEIEKVLKTLGVKQESQAWADELTSKGLSLNDQLAKARKIKDPDVRDAVVDRLKVRESERRDKEKQDREDNLNFYTNKIIEAKKVGVSMEEMLDLAGSQNVRFGEDKMQLREIVRRMYMRETAIDYPDKVMEARSRIDSGEIKSVTQLYREYYPYATDSTFTKLESYFQDGGAVGGLKDSRVQSIYKNITGKDPDKSKDSRQQYDGVWGHVINNLAKDREPTDEDIRKLVSQAVMEGEQAAGGWYDPDMNYQDAVKKGVAAQWLPNVSRDEKKTIQAALEAYNEANPGKQIPINDVIIRKYKKHELMGIPR